MTSFAFVLTDSLIVLTHSTFIHTLQIIPTLIIALVFPIIPFVPIRKLGTRDILMAYPLALDKSVVTRA